jgi:hypothetical protein
MSFQTFKKTVDNKLKFGLFLFTKLPSAYICGVRVRGLTEQRSVVSVPYKWLSQNPFKSIYFACQAMAAELSTGLFGLGYTYQSNPAFSMLVTGLECKFVKKATERIYFECNDGHLFEQAVNECLATGEARTFLAKSIGKTKGGEVVSEFLITWSFKTKGKKK